MRPEGLSVKIPMTLSGMEHATFRLISQCLDQLRHSVPRFYNYKQLLGALAKLKKATVKFVMFVLPYGNNMASSGLTLTATGIGRCLFYRVQLKRDGTR